MSTSNSCLLNTFHFCPCRATFQPPPSCLVPLGAASRELTCVGCTNGLLDHLAPRWVWWKPRGQEESEGSMYALGPAKCPWIAGSLSEGHGSWWTAFSTKIFPCVPSLPSPLRAWWQVVPQGPYWCSPHPWPQFCQESLHPAFSVSPLESVVCFLPRPQPLHSVTTTFFLFLSSSLLYGHQSPWFFYSEM